MAELSKVSPSRRAVGELTRQKGQGEKENRSQWATPLHKRQEDIPQQIQEFARAGGPDLCDLRGYSPSTYVSPLPKGKGEHSRPTKPITSYDDDFEQHLLDNCIYMDNKKSKPRNLGEILTRLMQPRRSLSEFPNSAFEDFCRNKQEIVSESKIMSTLLPFIHGNVDIPNEERLEFKMLESMTSGTIMNAQPDFYDGIRQTDVEQAILEDLDPVIIPTIFVKAPVLPNFFLEARGECRHVKKRKACYDGALGARAMESLQSFGQAKPIYDGNAYTITSTFHRDDGSLTIYATHLTQPEDSKIEASYHMTHVWSFSLLDSPEAFRMGAAAFRNARDWAMEQREKFLSVANEEAKAIEAEVQAEVQLLNQPPNPTTGNKRRDRDEASPSRISKIPRHEDNRLRSQTDVAIKG